MEAGAGHPAQGTLAVARSLAQSLASQRVRRALAAVGHTAGGRAAAVLWTLTHYEPLRTRTCLRGMLAAGRARATSGGRRSIQSVATVWEGRGRSWRRLGAGSRAYTHSVSRARSRSIALALGSCARSLAPSVGGRQEGRSGSSEAAAARLARAQPGGGGGGTSLTRFYKQTPGVAPRRPDSILMERLGIWPLNCATTDLVRNKALKPRTKRALSEVVGWLSVCLSACLGQRRHRARRLTTATAGTTKTTRLVGARAAP